MSTFTCPLVKVASVENHPDADRLSLVRLEGLGYLCISGKLEDGSPRYNAGDWVVYIPSGAVLTETLLKEMDFWNEETNKGTLAGPDGNRVKPMRLRGIFSEGVLYPADVSERVEHLDGNQDNLKKYWNIAAGETGAIVLKVYHADDCATVAHYDMSTVLGITKWEPPIPVAMQGEVANLFDHTIRYDFERVESVPDLFDIEEPVVALEKIHGTFTAIVFVPGLNHPEMFGSAGEIIVHSKGLGAQGLAFKNNETNVNNLYVRTLGKLLDGGLETTLRVLSERHGGKTVAILGETFGVGVQDLHYGTKQAEFRIFDIKVGDNYLTYDHMLNLGTEFQMPIVPLVYRGPYDMGMLNSSCVGPTTLNGGTNLREGIVIRSANETHHATQGRKIAKLISPDYLMRKNKNATEFN